VRNVPQKIRSLNARIMQLAEQLSLPYIDYYNAMVYNEGGAINPAYSDDGVHPNSLGYSVMEPLLLDQVKKITKH
jgi:lysophospholipase L1-like esterase